MFKSWGYRNLRNRVPENLQNFSEWNAEHLGKIIQSRVGDTEIYETEFWKIYRTFQSEIQNIQEKWLNQEFGIQEFTEEFYKIYRTFQSEMRNI